MINAILDVTFFVIQLSQSDSFYLKVRVYAFFCEWSRVWVREWEFWVIINYSIYDFGIPVDFHLHGPGSCSLHPQGSRSFNQVGREGIVFFFGIQLINFNTAPYPVQMELLNLNA